MTHIPTPQTDAIVASLVEIADSVLNQRLTDASAFTFIKPVLSELNRIDQLLFPEDKRSEFMKVKGFFERLKSPAPHEVITGTKVNKTYEALRDILQHYSPSTAQPPLQPFSFITDPVLKAIIHTDYEELHLRAYPNKAFKSTVLLAGSILEAILYDILSAPKNATNADAFVSGHHIYHNLRPISSERWGLEPLIDAAIHLHILTAEDSNIIHQTLRHYRNCIHPMKQRRVAYAIDDNRATLSIRSLDVVITNLEANYHP
jgi:hypothetical protein